MNGESKGERERRASDALLLSALRLTEKDEEKVDPESLPELTDEEKAAMRALGGDFMQRLLAGERPLGEPPSGAGPDGPVDKSDHGELALAGDDHGMNRAEEIDDTTAEELERRKREILDRKAGKPEGGTGGS
jgi:hypothetical protein